MTKFSRIKTLAKKNDFIEKAYNLAQELHKNQKRKNGEPYFNHVLATAESVSRWGFGQTSIAAALLHGVIEYTGYPLEKIKKEFGEKTAFLVEGVTKLKKIKYHSTKNKVENFRKLILSLSQDNRVIIIKLADRLNNMQTLAALPEQKQKRIALETLEIYAPIAYRLGLQWLSGELEDLSFPYVYPDEYSSLLKNRKTQYKEATIYIKKTESEVKKLLKKSNIDIIKITSRAKRYYSLYKKLLNNEMNIEKIYDLVALRIICKNIKDCYTALGIIHSIWPPLPGRIKDYIAMPKPNGYQSLHTTVFFIDNRITEIQIRTQEMDNLSETGNAAHWIYKSSLSKKSATKELQWVQKLQDWQTKFTSSKEFLEAMKIDFFKDRIFVVTPKGDVVDLPAGATPVDFAYQVHSEVGNNCSGAKINGKIAPLDYKLHSGDLVDILIQKNKKPSISWLNFVKTSTAKNHIRNAIKKKNLFKKNEYN